MALLTTRQQLEEVQTAISAVMLNQAYQLGSRTVTRANLEWLHKRELSLKHQLARLEGDRPVATAVQMSGMGY